MLSYFGHDFGNIFHFDCATINIKQIYPSSRWEPRKELTRYAG